MSVKSKTGSQKKVPRENALLALEQMLRKIDVVDRYCRQESDKFRDLFCLEEWTGVSVAVGQMKASAVYVRNFLRSKKEF